MSRPTRHTILENLGHFNRPVYYSQGDPVAVVDCHGPSAVVRDKDWCLCFEVLDAPRHRVGFSGKRIWVKFLYTFLRKDW